MKTVTMVDLRTQSEKIVRELLRGGRMTLSYRGRPVAELVPIGSVRERRTPLQALSAAQVAAGEGGERAAVAEAYLHELREDQKGWGGGR